MSFELIYDERPEGRANARVARLRRTLGENVRRLRKHAKMPKGAFAAMAGVSRPTLDKIESGGANPTLATLARLAEALGTDPHNLLAPHPGNDPAGEGETDAAKPPSHTNATP